MTNKESNSRNPWIGSDTVNAFSKTSVWDKACPIAGGVAATGISHWLIKHGFLMVLFGYGAEQSLSDVSGIDKDYLTVFAGCMGVFFFASGFYGTRYFFKKLEKSYANLTSRIFVKILWIILCAVFIILLKSGR